MMHNNSRCMRHSACGIMWRFFLCIDRMSSATIGISESEHESRLRCACANPRDHRRGPARPGSVAAITETR